MVMAFFAITSSYFAQTSTDFWFAPPEVSAGHGDDFPMLLRIATSNDPANVTIEMPANPGFNGGNPITLSMGAFSSQSVDLTAFQSEIETRPMDQVLNTGIHISSDADITVYYELNTTYNPEIFALKGLTGLGTEFYTPFQQDSENGNYSPTPYTSFDIVATEDNTTVIVYPRVDLDGGHSGLSSYTVTLNKGQTYSGGVMDDEDPNPAGTAIAADKPIAVSVKDDSIELGVCRDLIGDQLVPVEITGKEYIVNKGSLNTPDRLIITATENVTTVEIAGVYQTTLFTGETFIYDITDPLTFVKTSKPVYAMHITGFGCEQGAAILPPLNCAGSEQVSFTRSNSAFFALNLLVRAGAEGNFAINGDASLIQASDFSVVPGTDGEWMGAQISYSIAEIAVDQAYLITNDMDVFAMGLINGGATSGCRFGYFSEFAAQIVLSAGEDATTCANVHYQLDGSVSGGSTSGIWTTSGTGEFLPNAEVLDATYVPGPLDLLNGQVVLTLTSTGPCFPVVDQMILNFSPLPIVNAGEDVEACANSPIADLVGVVQNATGGLWSGGNGVFGSTTDLNTTYTPTAAEVSAGSVTLTLSSTGNGVCDAISDNVEITFGPAPTANAGANISVCENNANAQLAGNVTGAGGGIWSGGSGVFLPSPNVLTAIYQPTPSEISSGSLTLTLTTTDVGSCNPVSDNVLVTFTAPPTADAGADQDVCGNNAEVQLNGNVAVATGGVWTGGSGVFTPSATAMNATYMPTQGEIDAGSLTLTLTTTGNSTCLSTTDQMTINFTPIPVVNAGSDILTCEDDLEIELLGLVNGSSTTGTWTTSGTGEFLPNAESLDATYMASAQDAVTGTITLTLTSTNVGDCIAVSDELTLEISPEVTVNAGPDLTYCSNNVDAQLNAEVLPAGSTVVWTSSGSGAFVPSPNVANPVYQPSAADLISGGITLTITAEGSCNEGTDEISIDFTPAPTVNAGSDQQLCSSAPSVNILGLVNGTTNTGQWSTDGTGSFVDNNSLSTQYLPSIEDYENGQVILTLTSTNNGDCLPVDDQIVIYFSDAIEVYAGENQQVCVNSTEVQLNGEVMNGAGTGEWTTSGTGTFNNTNLLDAVYTFSPEDIAAGAVFLTLTSTNNGDCEGDQDIINVTFGQTVFASAGLDMNICASQESVQLNGFASGGSITGEWTTTGTGTFNDPALGNALYFPSEDDLAAGDIELYFTSTNNGSCLPGQDTTILTMSPVPTISVGEDIVLCTTLEEVDLTAEFTNADGVIWTTTGSGSFTQGDDVAETAYLPSQTDSDFGSIYIFAQTTGTGSCDVISDTLIVSFGGKQLVDAGEDVRVCGSLDLVEFSGSIVGDNVTYFWTHNGTGTMDNPNALNMNYSPGEGEQQIEFILHTIDEHGCGGIQDTVIASFDSELVIDAGEDMIQCGSVVSFPVDADIDVAEATVWTTTGSGAFEFANMASTVYTPSGSDVVLGGIDLIITTQDDNACGQFSDTVHVEFDNSIVADFDFSTACFGSPTSFTNQTAVTSGTLDNMTWFFGDEGVSSAENTEWTFSTTGLYDVTLTADLAEGCSSTITKQVEVVAPPVADFIFSDNLVVGEPISFDNMTAGNVTSEWDFGTGSDSSSQSNPAFIYGVEGDYTVTLVATNSNGCVDSTFKVLTVLPGGVLPPKTPTGFSPNNDGENDVFFVRGGPFVEMTMTVYNGWGEPIFTSEDQSIGWDGTHKGKDQPVGVYVYVVKALTETGAEYNKSGKVTLIR